MHDVFLLSAPGRADSVRESQGAGTIMFTLNTEHQPGPLNFSGSLREFSPGNFALVMATGIISTAAYAMGLPRLAFFLFAVNVAAYLLLCLLYAARAVRYPRCALADLFDHLAAFGYFTFVAATGILGAGFVLLFDQYRIATVLWWIGLISWAFFTYAIFAGLSLKSSKPTLDEGIGGVWLLSVVATQSVALLGLQLAPHVRASTHLLELFALSMWLWGGMLYIWIMALIFFRYTFLRLSPERLQPPYWINMGAMAIATLVGTALIERAPTSTLLASLLPFVKGFTLFYWAAGTWWLPMLLILGVWRHLYRRLPLRYDPLYWSVVFPLGMYSACTHALGVELGVALLVRVAQGFLWVAVLAWAVVIAGVVRRLARLFRQRVAG